MKIYYKLILVSIPLLLAIIFIYESIIYKQIASLLSVVSVLIGASISSCSIILYNDYINEQTRRKNEEYENKANERIINSLKNDLLENIVILNGNKKRIQNELEKDSFDTTPLKEFKTGFWELIKLNVPKELENLDIDTVSGTAFLSVCVLIMEGINEKIRLKETYKIMNFNIKIDNDVLHAYNKSLMNAHEGLTIRFTELFELLDYNSHIDLLETDFSDK